MQFLKTIFWVLVAVLLTFFSYRNWAPVTLSLWGDIEADIKIPVLLLIFFVIGFLPTWLIMRTKLWTCRRRVEVLERTRVPPPTVEHKVEEEGQPVE